MSVNIKSRITSSIRLDPKTFDFIVPEKTSLYYCSVIVVLLIMAFLISLVDTDLV